MLGPIENLARGSVLSVLLWLLMIALVPAGCDSAPTAPPIPLDPGPSACKAGEFMRDDGVCQPAGLPPDMPCPPGEMLLEDGITCQKAGVPPSACGAGFVPDGKDGCEPILPADPCPPGQMAVPGETVCHEVAPCGSGTWGDIPVGVNTQFVDQAYAGGNSDGTQAHPWTTIQQGVDHAGDDAIVAVAAGSYAEDVVIEGRRVRLWGRCPALVEVTGTGAQVGAIQVRTQAGYLGAEGTEVHGVAVTGAKAGIVVSGLREIVIEDVWIHDTAGRGIIIEESSDYTFDPQRSAVVLRGSLVEQSHRAGVLVSGSAATIEATVVRSTLTDVQGEGGSGIETVKSDTYVTVRSCVVEQNHGIGVDVGGSKATIEATVVRSTLPNAQGTLGRGINIACYPGEGCADVTIRACLIEQSRDVGVFVTGSNATLEATVVRKTRVGVSIRNDYAEGARASVNVRACLVEQNDAMGIFVEGSDATLAATVVRSTMLDASGHDGRGIEIESHAEPKARANVTVYACLVEQNRKVGILVLGSDATIEATTVRSTLVDVQAEGGRGIDIERDPGTHEGANVTIRACLLEQNHEIGVFVDGSEATIETTEVRSTLPNGLGNGGRGINIQDNQETRVGSQATVRGCVVEKSHESGIFIAASDATITGSTVRDTAPRGSDDRFGDGIDVFGGNVSIQNGEVTHNARAGVASFGGRVLITGGVIHCNAFDLAGEPFDNTAFSFDGSTGWQCSAHPPAECTVLGSCHIETVGIEAPSALPPLAPVPKDS